MTTPFWCLFIACLLPYVWGAATLPARRRPPGSFDNKNPRRQQAQLKGLGARAVAAHKNAFEAIAYFAPAVTVAHLSGGDPSRSAQLAIVFVVARLLHGLCYLADLDVLRSLSFFVGLACTVWLFLLGA